MADRLVYFLSDFRWFLVALTVVVVAVPLALVMLKQSRVGPQWKSWLLAGLTSFFFLIIVFILGEAYFRYGYDQSDGIGYLLVNRKWHARHVVFNSNYRRDEEFIIAKRPEEFRIGVIGDSVAFGMGINRPQDRFTDRLRDRLRQDGVDVSVYNLGLSGVDTEAEIKVFKDTEYLDFDMVVWEYFLNDANTATASANTQITRENRKRLDTIPVLKNFFDHSYLADFLYWRLASTYDKTFKALVTEDLKLYHDPKIFRGHEAQIQEFIHYLRNKDIPTVVVVFPLIHSEAIRQESQAEYDLVLTLFKAGGADVVIDLASALKDYPIKKLKASWFDQHPNELVHQIAAEILYPEVMKFIKK